MREIVLDPELRARLLDEGLYRSPARERLIAVELESRCFVRVALFRESTFRNAVLVSPPAPFSIMASERKTLTGEMKTFSRDLREHN
jgi:hypothetical protein